MRHLAKHERLRSLLVIVAALSLILSNQITSAQAANGSNLRTFIADERGTACASINDAGDHKNIGIGIAFDGANLLISCEGDRTLTVISPANGAQVGGASAVHFIKGANPLSALAFQGPAGPLWACGAYFVVGTVDLLANTFTPVFDTSTVTFPRGGNGSGCRDGLAFDAQDNSIAASGDASPTTEHYTATGAPLGKFSNSRLIGTCGNSGIAVGGPLLD